jgi:neutral ceramidase
VGAIGVMSERPAPRPDQRSCPRTSTAERTQGARRLARLAACALAATLLTTGPAHAAGFRAGVGKADIQPPTGYLMMGWARTDARTVGQHTRLFARALVLENDGRKVALVAADLNGIPGGMLEAAVKLVEDRGFSKENVLVSASHTHAAPAGFYNFAGYNTAFPALTLRSLLRHLLFDPIKTFKLIAGPPADRTLYSFMVRRLARALERADDDLGPAAVGWGTAKLHGVTENRSIEAHLANHGLELDYDKGSADMDDDGVAHTIDPDVDVLRVDKLVDPPGEPPVQVPIGGWSTFANHGTANRYRFNVYNQDHHGSAIRVFEDEVRRRGDVPHTQEVVNVYGNADEGDMSAGLHHDGPAHADRVGRREAAAMLEAWREAGRRLSRQVPLDLRWTRFCFCGQRTEGGAVDKRAVMGVPQLTGSEEGRGPLYDLTRRVREGDRGEPDAPQGPKMPALGGDVTGEVPEAVPIMTVRLGDRLIVSVPGEITAEMGRRLGASVMTAVEGSGIRDVVISGLANEYLSYFTTPREYDRQHYEGGATLFGRLASNLLAERLTDLARRLAEGRAAPSPYLFDPTNGVRLTTGAFDSGATEAKAVTQPAAVDRLQQVHFRWRGAPNGRDRPLDRAFVSIERWDDGWQGVADDLGLQLLWTVHGGTYDARWQVPHSAPLGTYRFAVTANHYGLHSKPFRVGPTNALTLRPVPAPPGRRAVALDYPRAVPGSELTADLTWRPRSASGGEVRFRVGDRTIPGARLERHAFSVTAPPNVPVSIPPGAARDEYGNVAARGRELRP